MNMKTKITAMFLVTFIVGMVVGALLNGAIHKRRIEKIREMRGRGGFKNLIIGTVNPDETQKILVLEILDKYENKIQEMRNQDRAKFQTINDSMMIELSSVLTPEQNQLLKEKLEEMRSRRGRPGDRRGERGGNDSRRNKDNTRNSHR